MVTQQVFALHLSGVFLKITQEVGKGARCQDFNLSFNFWNPHGGERADSHKLFSTLCTCTVAAGKVS